MFHVSLGFGGWFGGGGSHVNATHYILYQMLVGINLYIQVVISLRPVQTLPHTIPAVCQHHNHAVKSCRTRLLVVLLLSFFCSSWLTPVCQQLRE